MCSIERSVEDLYTEELLELFHHPIGKVEVFEDLDSLYDEETAQKLEEHIAEIQHLSHHPTDQFAKAFNPNCGDDITLRVIMQKSNSADRSDEEKPLIIEKIEWAGIACTVTSASVSLLVRDAQNITFSELRQNQEFFDKIKQFPERLPCALLPWKALASVGAKLGLTENTFESN
jgi:NifU-like protein involved in Fe-S cluster formation